MVLTGAQRGELLAHASAEAPNECCGWIRLREGRALEVVRCENIRASPYGYELDSKSLLAANEADDDGDAVAIYHSHPRSAAEPSQTDINLALYPHWLYVIVSLAPEPGVRAWRIADGRVEEEEVDSPDDPLTCPSCGRRRPLDERFCGECQMPLVYTPDQGEFVKVAWARNQSEAEMIQGMLRGEGIPSLERRQRGFDVPDFMAGGPRDILVPASGLEAARELLGMPDEPDKPPVSAPRPVVLAGVILVGALLAAGAAWALLEASGY